MPELKVGDSFPAGVSFSYIPTTSENSDIKVCGIPQQYDASAGMYTPRIDSFSNKKMLTVML